MSPTPKSVKIAISGWTLAEILILYLALGIFRPETIKDQFTDIFVGLMGATTSYLFILRYNFSRKYNMVWLRP